MSTYEQQVTQAVLYALKCGCFFPVRQPNGSAPVAEWIRWGALRHLHDVIAELPSDGAARDGA